MGEVLSLAEHAPHLSGDCRCLDCGHEWIGVAPVGTACIDCPKCGAVKGARFAMVMPEADEPYWTCACGNIFFVMTEAYTMCPNCGTRQIGYH